MFYLTSEICKSYHVLLQYLPVFENKGFTNLWETKFRTFCTRPL